MEKPVFIIMQNKIICDDQMKEKEMSLRACF